MKKLFTSFLFLYAMIVTAMAAGHIITTTQTNVTCNDSCNGSAIAIVSGGIGPYGYQWNDPMNQTTDTAKNLCAGTYTVIITDSSDMSTATTTIIIIQPSAINIIISVPSPVCPETELAITITATGGTPGGDPLYYYVLDGTPPPTDGEPGTTRPENVFFIHTTPGGSMHTAYVTDTNGCTAYASFSLVVPFQTVSSIFSTHISSCGACDGTASVSPIGASPFTYSWSPVSSTLSSLTGLCSGNYSVNITDTNGCVITSHIKVLDPPLKANYTMVPDSANSLTYWGYNSSIGSGVSYWDFGDGDSSDIRSPIHNYSTDGVYDVCLTVSLAGGCTDIKCTTINVSSTSGTCLSLFNLAHDTTSVNPNAYVIYNFSYGSTLSYFWDFGDGTFSFIVNPLHEYSGTGPYSICLTVNNGSDCSQTYCNTVTWIDTASRESMPLSVKAINAPQFGVTTGIRENDSAINSINVFPNPFADITTFEIPAIKSNTYSFEMTDVLGKKVRSLNEITGKQFQISREGLDNGIYFYKVYCGKSVIGIGKLVIE